jgi:hypothetical protein
MSDPREEEAQDVEICLSLNMGDIEDDDLIREFYRRFPWEPAEPIKTILENCSVEDIDPALITRLKAWLEP